MNHINCFIYRIVLITICAIYSSIIKAYDVEVNGLYYNLNVSSKTATVTYKGGGFKYSGKIIIPETIIFNGSVYSVTSIGEYAFYDCTNLTGELTIPNTIKSIQDWAFRGCYGLTGSLNIPNSVTSIGNSAFYGCSGFSGSLIIPNSVTYLGSDAFEGCNGFSGSLVISNSVTSIRADTFSGCSGLTGTLTIPNSVKTIGSRAFSFCRGFTGSLTIPNSVTSVGSNAFYGCNNMTGVLTIPNSVNSIGEYAFYAHFQLVRSEIEYPFEISAKTFYNVSSNLVLQVPTGTKDRYIGASGWCDNFNEIVEYNNVNYNLTIKTTGNGNVLYGDFSLRNNSNSFVVTDGTLAIFSFEPDNGFFIKNLIVNGIDVISTLASYNYSLVISQNTTIEVVFEAIASATHTLSIKATGNGSASFDDTTIKNSRSTFTVNEGTSATITFTPDNGYRIKSVKVNNSDVTSKVSNNSYTISDISGDTTVEVEFEAIPPTTYTLLIKATGNGSASYDGTTIREKTSTFTVIEGTDATISFSSDNGYRIKSVKVNNVDVTSNVSNNSCTISNINGDTTVEVEFEAIPTTTYTLSVKATGYGSASYGGTTVRGKTSTFTVNEGTDATITFSPDDGYRVKSVVVDGYDVTSSVWNNSYTVSNISSDTTVEVEFEAIPPTTYTLSIKATGNGSASYDGTTIREKTSTFTVNEGSSATITFSSDNGYRIKSVKVNNSDVTSSVSNSSYTVSNISRNTTVEVEFEAIPITTYTLTIKATGNGSASYEGTTVKNKTNTFTANKGTNATITFTPDNGYRIKSVKVNNTNVTSNVSNNKYTVSNISGNTTVEVEFEVIPPTIYTLSIKATGNGGASYDGTSVRGKTSTFNVEGGTSATITFSPDNGNRIKSVKVNSADVTSQVMNNSYTISNISGNTTLEVEFEEIVSELTYGGIYYKVESEAQQTVKVVSGDYGLSLEVPASFTAKNKEWKVVGIEADVLNNAELAAIIWNPDVAFSGKVNNPNLLLYVKDKKYAPEDIKNVVVNGEAENIELIDAENGNNFYCPQTFKAKRISYVHRYSMKTGFKTCQGWETIVLPFDVATILSATGTEIVPYSAWQQGSNSRPFWLYSMNSDGWKAESSIKANVPYIISMPNNEEYEASYNLSGDIQFTSSNVQVISSDNLSASKCDKWQFVPNYQNKVASQDIYALNVNSQLNTNTATETEGSAFIRSLRQVRPFEAYMAIEGNAGARRVIPVFEDEVTGIPSIPVLWGSKDDAIYNLNGQRVNSISRGVYIQNGKKIIKK